MFDMKNKSSNNIDSMLAMVIFVIIAMPIFGIYLCAHPNSKEEDKTVGIIMIVLGILIWLIAKIIGS